MRPEAHLGGPVDIPHRIARGLGRIGEIGFGTEGVQVADHHFARRFLDLGRDLAACLRWRHHDLFRDQVGDDRRGEPIPQAAAEFLRCAARPPDHVAIAAAAVHAADRPCDVTGRGLERAPADHYRSVGLLRGRGLETRHVILREIEIDVRPDIAVDPVRPDQRRPRLRLFAALAVRPVDIGFAVRLADLADDRHRAREEAGRNLSRRDLGKIDDDRLAGAGLGAAAPIEQQSPLGPFEFGGVAAFGALRRDQRHRFAELGLRFEIMIALGRRRARRLIGAETEVERVGDATRRVAAEHHAHRAAQAAATAAGHRGESGHRRDVHFIAFLGAGGLLRRSRNGGEHRGNGGDGHETQTRTHANLPVVGEPHR